jgi:hypothetical protein
MVLVRGDLRRVARHHIAEKWKYTSQPNRYDQLGDAPTTTTTTARPRPHPDRPRGPPFFPIRQLGDAPTTTTTTTARPQPNPDRPNGGPPFFPNRRPRPTTLNLGVIGNFFERGQFASRIFAILGLSHNDNDDHTATISSILPILPILSKSVENFPGDWKTAIILR